MYIKKDDTIVLWCTIHVLFIIVINKLYIYLEVNLTSNILSFVFF